MYHVYKFDPTTCFQNGFILTIVKKLSNQSQAYLLLHSPSHALLVPDGESTAGWVRANGIHSHYWWNMTKCASIIIISVYLNA